MSKASTSLRQRIANGRPLLLPGAFDALTALVVAELGFEAVYVSGAGVTNASLGVPDIGLITLMELAGHVQAMREVVDIPIVVDADTGFGGPMNVRRTVQVLQRAGADAIQLEDQTFPKRCGHFTGKDVIPTAEMEAKLAAALDARASDDLLIIARTDARANLGIDEAIQRVERYRQIGADVAFVEAPLSEQELVRVGAEVNGPKLVNMIEGGLTPVLPAERLGEMGFTIILYANSALRAAVYGIRTVLGRLHEDGTTLGVVDAMVSWDERQRLVGKPSFDEMELRYEVKE